MCGILGAYSREGVLPERDCVALALDKLRLRGPDDSGLWADNHVRLGHRRLAIVELSAAGHQPMESHDGRYVVVFNGEIYNHLELRQRLPGSLVWRGGSDTETLLEAYRAWGPDCLRHLFGMFAFAIWDRCECRLFVARDRLGVKPLYYRWSDGQFAFASRPAPLSVLTGDSPDVDPEAFRLYMDLGYIPAPLSFDRNVRKLLPGHYLLVDQRGLHCSRYWDYRHIAPDPRLLERPEGDLLDELDALVRSAVRLRLMSDVPLGAFLSGGTDSALVVAAMKAAGVDHPKTFTIGFHESAFDEAPAAARIANHIGVDHTHELLAIGDLLSLLPEYLDAFDEPLSDNSAFATMAVSRLARRHVTVALTGDGSDELFGGYPQYQLMQQLTRLQRLSPRMRASLRALLTRLPWHRGKLLSGAMATHEATGLFAYLRSMPKDFAPVVSQRILGSTSDSHSWFSQVAASFAMDLNGAEIGSRIDLSFTLSDDYLQKVDIASMAYSIEARCPLTDHRLVEWAMRLPWSYKVRNGESKYLLKKVLCRYLPPELVYQPKMGFSLPVAQWLRGPLRLWAQELLHDQATMSRLPLERSKVLELFDLHISGKRNVAPLLWTVLMLLCFVARQHSDLSLPALTRQRAA
jgi:asparagine synthase (glutamine-hydrolysing)